MVQYNLIFYDTIFHLMCSKLIIMERNALISLVDHTWIRNQLLLTTKVDSRVFLKKDNIK